METASTSSVRQPRELVVPDRGVAGEPRRRSYTLNGEILDDDSLLVWSRLESLRSGRPQLSKRDVVLRLFIWRVWRRAGESYQLAAMILRCHGLRASKQSVYQTIKRMRAAGILDGIRSAAFLGKLW